MSEEIKPCPFEVVSIEPWKDGVVRIRIAADEPEGRVCHTFYARQEDAPSEAVGLLRALMDRLDSHFGGPGNDWKEQEQARRFLAAQEP